MPSFRNNLVRIFQEKNCTYDMEHALARKIFQSAFTCSKLTIETLEQRLKYI